MNKILKYTVMIFTATLFMMSCEKNEIVFDAVFDSNLAYVQIHNQIPVLVGSDYNFYKVELNGLDICRNGGEPAINVPLNSWNSLPSSTVGRYFGTTVGQANIKLYQGPNRELKYDQNVTLQAGKQGLILYDLSKPPMVITEPDNFENDRVSFYTDTIQWVKFFNIMREGPGAETTLKLQYQYQYVYNPLYTELDGEAGKIPAGYKVGDLVPTANRIRSPWINLGAPVGFGENTGWTLVPVKKEGWITQGSARVDYRILVAQGGTVGVNMNADNVLLCRDSRPATGALVGFTDYWTGYVGRKVYHFFSGYRDSGVPGMELNLFYQR